MCRTHPLAPISTSFPFVFDSEWVMSTCEHQDRDTVLQTGLKIHWSRRSACCHTSSCFNRAWRVTKSSAKHQSMLRPWVMQHQPWPSPSAWTKTRSFHGCRHFHLLILPSPLSLSLSLSLFCSLFLKGPTSVVARDVSLYHVSPRSGHVSLSLVCAHLVCVASRCFEYKPTFSLSRARYLSRRTHKAEAVQGPG